MTHRVTLIPGDGIGPEVVEATRSALEATGVAFEWDYQDAGAAEYLRGGDPLPARVVESIRERGVALKGPTSTPRQGGFRSINIALRRELGLHTGVRPCRAYPGALTRFPGTDLVVVRMNDEDLYAGIEYAHGDDSTGTLRRFILETDGSRLGEDTGISIKPISISGVARVAHEAFRYAVGNGRSRVTAVHKATVMRHTDGLFLETAREVARGYPAVAFDDRLVDNLCHELVRHPEASDVLLLPVLYGDLISDLGAGLVGGLGLAPGANIGDEHAVFEAVHGSAPRRGGHNVANPMALMLSGVMLLRHLAEPAAADRLEAAIAAVIEEGRALTYDMKVDRDDPSAVGTSDVAEAVARRLERGRER